MGARRGWVSPLALVSSDETDGATEAKICAGCPSREEEAHRRQDEGLRRTTTPVVAYFGLSGVAPIDTMDSADDGEVKRTIFPGEFRQVASDPGGEDLFVVLR